MKKMIKLMLASTLLTGIISTNLSVLAEEVVEEASTEESVGSLDEGESTEEAIDATITGEPVENAEEVLSLIKGSEQTKLSRKVNGLLSVGFAGGGTNAQLLGADYGLTYKFEPRFSAEIDLNASLVMLEEPIEFFAYIHNGKFLEHRDEKWYSDDISASEDFIVEVLTTNEEGQEDLKAKYMDVLESENHYILQLKEDVDVETLYTDLDSVYNFNQIKEQIKEQISSTGSENSEGQVAIVDALFSEERIKESLSSAQYQLIYDKENTNLVNSYVSLNIDVVEIYELMGIDPSTAPTSVVFVAENSFTSQGEDFDFSFLDEIAPAE